MTTHVRSTVYMGIFGIIPWLKMEHDPSGLGVLEDMYRGGDLFWLICTCVRTERVRKLFFSSIILNEFLCGKVQIPRLRKR